MAKSVLDTLPPQSLEAEQAVLGSMLLDRSAADALIDYLQPEDFYREAYRRIYDVMLNLQGEGRGIDFVTVAEELRRCNIIDQVGGPAELVTLLDSVPTVANANYYAEIVKELSEMRQCISMTHDAAEVLHRRAGTWRESVEQLRNLILNVALDRKVTNNSDFNTRILELCCEAVDRKEDIELRGIGSGFPSFDRKSSGYNPGELWLLGARPSMGKSAMGLSQMQHIARKHHVGLFSLEPTQDAICWRLMGMISNLPTRVLQHCRLSEAEREAVGQASTLMKDWKLTIHYAPGMTTGELRRKARLQKSAKGLDLIMVDHLSLIKSAGPGKRYDRTTDIADEVLAIAGGLNVPIVGLVQLSRECDKRDDKRPLLSDFRDTGAWEQNAQGAVAIYRPRYYEKHLPQDEEHDGEMIVLKNRDGAIGTIPIQFDPKRTFFWEKEQGYGYG
jgi:replicative DNA helicase